MQQKVFITGATGVLGKRLIKILTGKGIQVVGLSRSPENSILLEELGAEPRQADLYNIDELIEATKDCTAIFHLATKIPKKPMPQKSDWAENDKIRTEGTQALVKAALANHIKIFIQQSITFIYGDQKGAVITSETLIPDQSRSLLRSAVEMENIVRNEKRIDHLIVRFGLFYSEDSYGTQDILNRVRKRQMPVIGKGDFYWNYISVDDAARALEYALLNFERLKNHSINFTDFSPIRFKDMVLGLASLTGSKKPFTVPTFLAKLILDKDTYLFLTASHRISQDKLIMDWKPRDKNFLEGMKKILK